MKGFRKFKKGDLLIILVLGIFVIVSPLFLIYSNDAGLAAEGGEGNSLVAEISRDNQVIQRIDLNKLEGPKHIELEDGIHMTILAENGRIKVLESDCPNQICVAAGWLTQPGDFAVCAPNEVTVTIDVP